MNLTKRDIKISSPFNKEVVETITTIASNVFPIFTLHLQHHILKRLQFVKIIYIYIYITKLTHIISQNQPQVQYCNQKIPQRNPNSVFFNDRHRATIA